MTSFFEKNKINWLPIDTLFANTTTFLPNLGIAHFSLSPLDTCVSNCLLFHNQQDECKNYCHSVQDVLVSSIDYAARACDTSTQPEKCCKTIAGTDDNAYIYCLEHTRPKRQEKKHTFCMIIISILSVGFLIYLCIGILLVKKMKQYLI